MWLAALAAAVTFLALFGLWNRENADSQAASQADAPSGLFLASQASGTSLASVARVTGFDEHCTAWLLETGAAAQAQAYAVTSGRCVGALDPATPVVGRAVEGVTAGFRAFAPLTKAAEPTLLPVPVDEVVWASSGSTDLAVLRLGATYAELAAAGVDPIRPVAAPAEGTRILVAGVPIAGIAPEEQFLRGATCTLGSSVDVREGRWSWPGLRASDCGGILGGSAGSPAFSPAGEAVAMVTTTTIGAPPEADCAVGRPCEVRDGQVRVVPDTTYLVAVDALAGCFPDGSFSADEGCALR